MRSFKLFAAVMIVGTSAAAADEASFASLDVQMPGGRALHAQASDLALRSSSLLLAGEGFVVAVDLPKSAHVGDTLVLPATLQAADQLQQGTLTLAVREAGPFLAGSLTGSFGPLTVSGSLRVKRVPPTGLGAVAS